MSATQFGTITTPTMQSGKLRTRTYPIFGGGPGNFIRIDDGTTPFLAYLARTFPSEFDRAVRHIGWWGRNELKRYMDGEGSPDGSWPDLSELQSHRVLDVFRDSLRAPGGRFRAASFGDLARAIGYRHEKAKMRVQFGWLSRKAARIAYHLQEGYTTKVTDKMRKMFFAAGRGLRAGTSEIVTPARDLVNPVFREIERELPRRMEKRIQRYLNTSGSRFAVR